MQNNYYFLRPLSAQLQRQLEGWLLCACFSQEKDELILGFCTEGAEFYIKAVLTPSFATLAFPPDFSRARRNSADLFRDLIGSQVLRVVQHLNERSFSLFFESDFQLVFKMHGNRSNVILFKSGVYVDMFHNKLINDTRLDPASLDRELRTDFATFEQVGFDPQKLYPTLSKGVLHHLKNQGFDQNPPAEKWTLLNELIAELENAQFYVSLLEGEPVLSLLPVGDIRLHTPDPMAAANAFYQLHNQTSVLEHEKQAALRKLEKRRTQSESYLLKTRQKLTQLENESRNEQTANLLMANMHQIAARAESVELFDFYENRNRTVKLKKDLSAQKNAENYYRKAKNEKIEIAKLQEAITAKETELKRMEGMVQHIREAEQFKALRGYLKEQNLLNEKVTAEPDQLFKRFEYRGFEILMGRNAKNNDLLTQKYAYKEDLWLHAKDVAGSHVVIKYQAGKTFPEPVIEKAAGLAAFYSKKKTDSLCPVIVTPKKYVRKPKGLADGEVVVDKESVILVVPATWDT